MLLFAEYFPDEKTVVSLSRQFSWSHLLVLLPLNSIVKSAYPLKNQAILGIINNMI